MYGDHQAIRLRHARLGSVQQIRIKAVPRAEDLRPLLHTTATGQALTCLFTLNSTFQVHELF